MELYGIKMITCNNCHRERPHKARGLCTSCYQAWYRKSNPPQTRAAIREVAIEEVVAFVDSFLSAAGGRCRVRGGGIDISLGDKSQHLEIG